MRLAVVVGLLIAGCYAPTPQEGAPCAANGACPEGLRCIDDRCVSDAPADGGLDASDISDASIDAAIDAPASGVQFVQAAYASSVAPVTSLTVALPQPQTAGSINVVFVSWFSPDGLVSITDTQGASYQQRINPPGGAMRLSAYTSGPLPGGANSVTVMFTGSTNFPEIRVLEYRGVAATMSVGQARRNQNTSSTCSVTIEVNDPGEVVVVANAADAVDTLTLSPGFVERLRTSPGKHIAGDFKPPTPGQLTASVGLSDSAAWVMEAITLRP